MFILIYFLILFLTGRTSLCQELSFRIVGGDDTPIERAPYTVSVQNGSFAYCGGSILNHYSIVTAAHCLVFETIYVRAGSSYAYSGGMYIRVERMVQHPLYSNDTEDPHDVGVIWLEEPLVYSAAIQPIHIVPAGHVTPPGTLAFVTGWGLLKAKKPAQFCNTLAGFRFACPRDPYRHTLQFHPAMYAFIACIACYAFIYSNGTVLSDLPRRSKEKIRWYPKVMQGVVVPVVSQEQCIEYYKPIKLSSTVICAGYKEGGKDACTYDSGGPLVVDGKLIAAVTGGYGCARPRFPGIYIDLAIPSVRAWVYENLKPDPIS